MGVLAFEAPSAAARWRVNTLFTKEPGTIAWIDAMPAGSVLWDVGANIGPYSLYAGSKGHPVVAVEPLPANYAALCKGIEKSGLGRLVMPLALALGDENNTYALRFKENTAGLASVEVSRDLDGAQLMTPIITLDALKLVFRLPAPTHIKIDVDGSEVDVLRGAYHTLMEVASVIVETVEGAPEQRKIDELLVKAGLVKVGRFVTPLYPGSSIGMDHWFRKDT